MRWLFESTEPFIGKTALLIEGEIAQKRFDQRRHRSALRAGGDLGLLDEVFFDGESEFCFHAKIETVLNLLEILKFRMC